MKIDYSKINWNASTYWELCGTKENLRIVWDRNWEYFGVRAPIEEFAYERPRRGLAFMDGDIVTYTAPNKAPRYATVTSPCASNGNFCIRFANGEQVEVYPSDIPDCIAIADIPDELVALARAEAGKPIDFSKCPLRNPECIKEETK